MRIRTRAFMLGLLPTLLVAAVLTAFHVNSRLDDLETTLTQRGTAIARHLAASAEYGVLSGNTAALENLLDQSLGDPGVKSAIVVWPDQTRLARGEPVKQTLPIPALVQWQDGTRVWFSSPVALNLPAEADPFIESRSPETGPLAWVAVSIDLQQKQALVRQLLLASLGITLLGLMLAILLIDKLALSGVQPLLDIVAAVKRISSGGFGSQVNVTAQAPELRELQMMVNQMSESLRSYRQDMEAKVRLVTAKLEHRKKEAEQASLAKSRFLATASHDLRQPMHAISLYVESLKPLVHSSEAVDILNRIERSINSTVELFNAILDLTRLDAGVVEPHLAPVRIRKLFLDLADEFAAEADMKGLSLRVRAPDVWVESDALLLKRIIRNLLSNAIRHATQGGILLSARPCQGQLRVQVWDTGSGIAPEHQPKIFEEFYQATVPDRHVIHGLGLGLAIVNRLTRLLNHPLQLNSRFGQGTVFTLDVPLAANGIAEEGTQPEGSHGSLSGRALVVDDDPLILNALGNLLRQWGMDVRPVRSLHQLANEPDAVPDVALVDYQLLNGESGLMVVKAIFERWGDHVPVILITGDTRTETIQRLRETGYPTLYKPVHANQLRALLASVLQEQSDQSRT